MKVETGVMVIRAGLGWGTSTGGGQGHAAAGWMAQEYATIYDATHVKTPFDVVSASELGRYREELRGARIVPVERRTEVIIKLPLPPPPKCEGCWGDKRVFRPVGCTSLGSWVPCPDCNGSGLAQTKEIKPQT